MIPSNALALSLLKSSLLLSLIRVEGQLLIVNLSLELSDDLPGLCEESLSPAALRLQILKC